MQEPGGLIVARHSDSDPMRPLPHLSRSLGTPGPTAHWSNLRESETEDARRVSRHLDASLFAATRDDACSNFMNAVIDTLVTIGQAIKQWFADASPLANAIQIVGPIVGFVFWFLYRRLRHKDGLIEDLRDDLADRKSKLDKARSELKVAEDRAAGLEAKLAHTALARADGEREQGNHTRANHVLREWVESEGDAISALLMRRARWAASHASGEVLEMGLTVAEAYAIAATVFDPEMNLGVALVEDIEAFRTAEGLWVPPLMQALAGFDDRADNLFDIDRVSEANTAESEASDLLRRGHYHLARAQIERALELRVQTVGSEALSTLRAQQLKCQVLLRLGHDDEALPLARATLEAQETIPALGPTHPDTLASRFLVAQILNSLGDDEALPIARTTLEARETSPALGPTHPDTLASRALVAQILTTLGHDDEALPIARATLEAHETSPALGPTHPDTLVSRSLVANILTRLGQHDEALPIARATLEAQETSPALGSAHPDTLVSRALVAKILHSLGQHDEALPIARAALEAHETSPALGPTHPDTLVNRALVAQILDSLGRYDEALPIARAALEAHETSPALGPTHPNTLTSRFVVAQILNSLGRYDEALAIGRAALEAQKTSPALGPAHPATLASLSLIANILTKLGQDVEAEPAKNRDTEM